jgi:ribonuclease Y
MPQAGLVVLIVAAALAVGVVLLARREAGAIRQRARAEADGIRERAADEADDVRQGAAAVLVEARQARVAAATERDEALEDLRAREARLDAREHRVADRALKLDEEERELDQQQTLLRQGQERLREQQQELRVKVAQHQTEVARGLHDLAERRRACDDEIASGRVEVEAARAAVDELRARELERVASLTQEQAREEVVAAQVLTARRQALVTVRQIEDEARRDGDLLARRIVADSIQRVSVEQTAESVVSVVQLPADDMKGRIIGREGRNIRSFEAVTGVNLVIDDTPGAVLLSCFDPVRRERARVALEALIADGRIHPQRIEAAFLDATHEVDRLIARAGAEAVEKVGIDDLHPELVQNVLGHLIETAQIASGMAGELGVDAALVKRCAFLHDIGKALTHEVEGTHAMIGADLARRFGESDEVVHAIAAHHNEVAPETVEAVLTQASDSCSGGRPGARREALESYVERLDRLEAIASSKEGVEKVFAMSAGRELRVMVQPDAIDDIAADLLARDIAAQIADELTYPGQIKVTVVRESRATATAS